MQRRNLLIGMGSLAAGGAATIGTGAFTQVSANRDMTVRSTGDMSALLKLEATSDYASQAGGDDNTLAIDLTGGNDTSATGINREATTTYYEVFNIKNQGSTTVGIHFDESPPLDRGTGPIESSQWFTSPEDKVTNNDASYNTWPDDQPPNFDADDDTSKTAINLNQFEYPDAYSNILAPGDDVSVGLFILVDESDSGNSGIGNLDYDGDLNVIAFSEQSALDARGDL